jgi:phosphatidylinositol alpha-1,6-mannosyltransferase
MHDDESQVLTRAGKLRFGSQVAATQMFGRSKWVLFGHLGPARVQALIPDAIERPYGVFLHGVEVWRLLSDADHRVLRRARLRVANSSYTARQVMKHHPDVGLVHVCPLALSLEDEQSITAPLLEGRTREPLVLMVGRMDAGEAYKGHALVIAAWPFVLAACPGARLALAGGGDDTGRLRGIAARAGVAQAIDFLGFVDRATLLDLYRRAALFALPSRAEGFGIVYLEAMAHRLPCIGSVHDAARDVIVDGETGYLVGQDSPRVIAERIVELLQNADLRARMGEAGFARLNHEFTFSRFAARMVALLDEHLERAEP